MHSGLFLLSSSWKLFDLISPPFLAHPFSGSCFSPCSPESSLEAFFSVDSSSEFTSLFLPLVRIRLSDMAVLQFLLKVRKFWYIQSVRTKNLRLLPLGSLSWSLQVVFNPEDPSTWQAFQGSGWQGSIVRVVLGRVLVLGSALKAVRFFKGVSLLAGFPFMVRVPLQAWKLASSTWVSHKSRQVFQGGFFACGVPFYSQGSPSSLEFGFLFP